VLHIVESSKILELRMRGAWILRKLICVLLMVACEAVVYESNTREVKCQRSKGLQVTLILVTHYTRQLYGSRCAYSVSEYALLGKFIPPPPIFS